MAVEITSPHVQIFSHLVFNHDIPAKRPRTRPRVAWYTGRTRRGARKQVGVQQNYWLAYQRARRIEEAKHSLLIAREVSRKQRNVAIDIGSTGTNYRISDRKSTRLNSSHITISY